MHKIVVTGNIGSGKSTIAKMISDHKGMPFFSSDECIQQIYRENQAFKQKLLGVNPDFISNHQIQKHKIIEHLQQDPHFWGVLEGLLYPLLEQECQKFTRHHQQIGVTQLLYEVPLLFEKELEKHYDIVILCYAPYDVRLQRALQRPNMTKEKFDEMNNRQVDSQSILHLVDISIDTSVCSPLECSKNVLSLIDKLTV